MHHKELFKIANESKLNIIKDGRLSFFTCQLDGVYLVETAFLNYFDHEDKYIKNVIGDKYERNRRAFVKRNPNGTISTGIHIFLTLEEACIFYNRCELIYSNVVMKSLKKEVSPGVNDRIEVYLIISHGENI